MNIPIDRTDSDPTTLGCRDGERLVVVENDIELTSIVLSQIVYSGGILKAGDSVSSLQMRRRLKERGDHCLDFGLLDTLEKRDLIPREWGDTVVAHGTVLRLEPSGELMIPVLHCHNRTWFWNLEPAELCFDPKQFPNPHARFLPKEI